MRVIDNRVQVSGQVAVMAINGLLTKIIFDKNPDHEFYVEESFPLDWMYPHLTPYGIIMKINRQQLPELGDDVVKKDHEFWSQYQERLIGNEINYDTTISNICAFAERTYFRRDYKKFKGDPKFIRDNDGQKAFSKLRSSIAGLYAYRIQTSKSVPEQQRMIKEAEFAFKQAYAFCPYSPEALFRYINLLIGMGRVDEAALMAETSFKLDPNNGQIENLIGELKRMKHSQAAAAPMPQAAPAPTAAAAAAVANEVTQLETQVATDPKNLQTASKLLMGYLQLQQNQKALDLVDKMLTNSQSDPNTLLFVANVANQLNQLPRVEKALALLVKITPDNPEAWFDLAGVQALGGKPPDAVQSLRTSLQLSAKRLAQNSNSINLYSNAAADARFGAIRQTPEFLKMMADLKPPGS